MDRSIGSRTVTWLSGTGASELAEKGLVTLAHLANRRRHDPLRVTEGPERVESGGGRIVRDDRPIDVHRLRAALMHGPEQLERDQGTADEDAGEPLHVADANRIRGLEDSETRLRNGRQSNRYP